MSYIRIYLMLNMSTEAPVILNRLDIGEQQTCYIILYIILYPPSLRIGAVTTVFLSKCYMGINLMDNNYLQMCTM
jgi:hypothetical protein